MSAGVKMQVFEPPFVAADGPGRLDRALQQTGDWLMAHQRAIRRVQWLIVAFYLVLVAVPAFLPLPGRTAHILDNLTLFAQFVFWGIWWPFVLASMVLVGRLWCGLLCPEGALTEFASRHGRGEPAGRLVTWGGWPFVAFALTTIYGQMVSVYQYPGAVLIVLGGSTAAAIVVGYLYGRGKRVWCRYLCPVSGVFGLLTKLAPLHFSVDQAAWRRSQRAGETIHPVNCAPLVPLGQTLLLDSSPRSQHATVMSIFGMANMIGPSLGPMFAGQVAETLGWRWGFWMIVPVLAIAGTMLGKKTVTPGPGTFPTDGLLFSALLVAVIVIVGALTFFPALCLGPIIEHCVALGGKTY